MNARRTAGNPFREPWRVMVLLIAGPVAAIGVAFAMWFGGNSYLFTSTGVDSATGVVIVQQPPRLHGAEQVAYQCREFAAAGLRDGEWYRSNCR